MSVDIAPLLAAATALAGQQGQQEKQATLESVLRSRLQQSYELTRETVADLTSFSLEDLRLDTATRALALLTRLQRLLENEDTSPGAVPLLGTRDAVVIQTLVSLVFNWGANALLASLSSEWPDGLPSTSHIVDLTDSALHMQRLLAFAEGVLAFLPAQRAGANTKISTDVVAQHITDVLRLGCTLGWAEALEHETRATFQARTLQLLAVLPPTRTISALGSLLALPAKQSETPPLPPHARKVVPGLLSQQLLRQDGVQGLCYAMLSDSYDQEDAPYDRLEHIAKVISTVPAGTKISAYFEQIIPSLFALLASDDTASTPPSHRRAAAFTLSRLLSPDFRHARITRVIILRTLHLPLLSPSPVSPPITALNHIVSLVTRMDPSPVHLSSVLTSIIPALILLLEHFERTQTTDAELRASARGLVLAWARVATHAEAVDRLWAVVQGEGGEWEGTDETLRRSKPHDSALPPLRPSDDEDADADLLASNPFMLKPNPVWFAGLLKDMGRNDVVGALFVRVLEAYQETQNSARADQSLGAPEADPRKPLSYLQIVVQIQSTMPSALGALAQNPERLLAFVRTTLERHLAGLAGTPPRGDVLESLRIVDDQEDELQDSDDEDSDTDELAEGGQMIVQVALSILLSLLELHEELLPSDTPRLNALTPLLTQLANENARSSVSRAAREASFVLRARLAAASLVQSSGGPSSQPKPPPADDDPQVIYQRALKLIQDPLLPVRASGLALLRSPGILREPALTPAVLDTFLRTVQDGESFVYLNAVQGLVALAMAGGDVIAALVRSYAGGIENAHIDVGELDKRLRVGEALGQVVKRLGEALAVQINTIVPPLHALLRARDTPAVLRASAVGLLAQCEESADLAMLPYAQDLCGAMLDVLQLETEVDTDAAGERKTLDDEPTSAHAKHPPLRRAAAHFLAMLLRARLLRVDGGDGLEDKWLQRAGVILGYVASTDRDTVVRAMCREASELVGQLFRARLGVE